MRRMICFAISVTILLYGLCYIEHNGTEDLPTAVEFVDFIDEKIDNVAETYDSVMDWLYRNGFIR